MTAKYRASTRRKLSGSIRSPSAVEPVTSQKRTVTVFRVSPTRFSAERGGRCKRSAAGVAEPSTRGVVGATACAGGHRPSIGNARVAGSGTEPRLHSAHAFLSTVRRSKPRSGKVLHRLRNRAQCGSGREARKTVTVVFSDMVGSTELGDRLDPEAIRRVMSRYFEVMQGVLERHGGIVEKFVGDAIMAVFGIPDVHEDDALRAIRAANEMRGQLQVLNDELEREWGVRLRVRTGVNTGEVVAGDPSRGQAFVSGDAVNVAARLEQAAAPDEILLGERTWSLGSGAIEAAPVPAVTLKGKPEPLPAWRLVGVSYEDLGLRRRSNAAFVGRADEMEQLRQAFERALRDQRCVLTTIVGPPGIGKSRLAEEFTLSLAQRARVVSGRCLPYGEGITVLAARRDRE